MGLEFNKNLAVASETVGVEQAETLLEWLGRHPRGRIDLSACAHLHAANLQVLMAGAPKIAAWPSDDRLRAWLRAAFNQAD